MITKARLTEDGSFQVDKEIIEYPEILSGGRNLMALSNLKKTLGYRATTPLTSNEIVEGRTVEIMSQIPSAGIGTIISREDMSSPFLFLSFRTNLRLSVIKASVTLVGESNNTIRTIVFSFYPLFDGYYEAEVNVASLDFTSIHTAFFWSGHTSDLTYPILFTDPLVANTNIPTPSTPAPEDLGLSYPSSIQNFTPSIHDDFILMPEIIESSISDKLQISPTQLKIPNLLIEQSIVPKYAASENLILHYDFKGRRNVDSDRGIAWDHSGNNNNGQLYNFVYNQTTGYDGIGLTFAGNQYIKFDNIIQPEIEEVTIDILINITSDATSGSGGTLFCCRNKLGEGISIFSRNNGIIRFDTGNATGNQWSSTYSIQYNTPTKITVTRDSNKRSLYINNQFHSSNNSPGYFGGLGLVTTMGASQVNDTEYANFLNGIIYSAKIYNRALTPEEITHNFQIDKLRFNINI